MNSETPEQRNHLRSLLLQRTRNLNNHIRHAAFAVGALDEGFNPVFNMPSEYTYQTAVLFRFDRIIREAIRMLVCLKSHLHQYQDGMRNVQDQLGEIMREPVSDRRVPLNDSQLPNLCP